MTGLPEDGSIAPPTPDGNATSQLTTDGLRRAVRAADSAAFLVLPRVLRRAIKHDRRLAGFGWRAPHRKSYVVGRESLLEVVEKSELGVDEAMALSDRVILLAQPSPKAMAESPAGEILLRCRRLLFHARVHVALEESLAAGRLTPAMVRERIHEIGPAEFEEIRAVLGQEELWLPPRDDVSAYVEFAATYWELRRFSPGALSFYFPGLEGMEAVDALLRRDVDDEELFEATRIAGAFDPPDSRVSREEWADPGLPAEPEPAESSPPDALLDEAPSAAKYRTWLRKAQRPASLGNVVRAAIDHARAERCAPPNRGRQAGAAVERDVERLIRRLQAALEIPNFDPRPWRDALLALVRRTPAGIWTVEARLLYDLQKACVDHERDVYTVDLVEWALSWGRRPIKRPLPHQRDVLMLKHLRSAFRRLAAARISNVRKRQLGRLVREATVRIESQLRNRLRPVVAAVLDEVPLVPRNLPERVARKKLIEELLDRIDERGFLTMGGLRDAISRNQLKLPDLADVAEFFHGDPLLRADRAMASALDGVHHRGEFYLRWMQRLSAAAFGTRVGRFLTRFAVVPFGGAFVALAGIQHLRELIVGKKAAEAGFQLSSPSMVATLGCFLLLLVNSATFRRSVGGFFKTFFRVVHAVAIEPIDRLLRSPWLQRILHSRSFTFLFRFVVKPLFWTGLIAWAFSLGKTDRHVSTGTSLSIFLAINLMLNSRMGRNAEEATSDWLVQSWRRFGLRLITGLFWFFIDAFERIVETIERLMYAVDEWLRFKSGEGRGSLGAKAVLGLLWFFAAYVLRFAVNVLIEPQINPIKHFPVVTVSHKLLLPLIPHFTGVLTVLGMEKVLAGLTAGAVITSIPGLFGFLVWELKENWRLYAANRRPLLGPATIGSHGETMMRLLKPGFHSGTLPKHFAKLRRAERRTRSGENRTAVARQLLALEHLALSIRRCVEREFLELFVESRSWHASPIALEDVHLSVNSVRFSLQCPDFSTPPLRLAIDMESGRLLAGIASPGWIDRLPPHQRQVLVTAILGLYKSLGIDLVRQQIESEFPPPMPWYEAVAEGLILWPDEGAETEVLYDLRETPWVAPQTLRGLPRRRLPTVERRRLVFADVPIRWQRWVEAWEQDAAGLGHPRDSVAPVCVFPPPERTA